jgi:hypothetical protein
VIVFIGYAIPGWVAGVLLLLLFSSHWEIFPLGGMVSDGFEDFTLIQKGTDILWHTALPLAAYVMGSFTVMTFLMKTAFFSVSTICGCLTGRQIRKHRGCESCKQPGSGNFQQVPSGQVNPVCIFGFIVHCVLLRD